MAIKTEYRLLFESEQDSEHPTTLEVSANEPDGDLAVWLSTPDGVRGEGLFLRLNREEAVELKAILAVLTGTANGEDDVIVGVAPD